MRRIVALTVAAMFAMIGVTIEAQDNELFKITLGKETLQGHLSGAQGVWKVNYSESHPFEVTDESGMVRGVFIDKIDKIEVTVPTKTGSSATVVVTVGDRIISGTFNGTDLFLVTETEKIELLKIKKGKVILTRVVN
jgi:hypothetical protein